MNRRQLAVVMDPIASIKPHKDSSLAMMLEAQRRGWDVHVTGIDDIWLRDGVPYGRLTRMRLFDDNDRWYEPLAEEVLPLADMNAILMRKDPPFNMEYIFATYVLHRAEDLGSIVINHPQGLRDANEKAFLAWLPECVPPILISRSLSELRAFIAEHDKIVVKPLDMMGGRSVFVTDKADGNCNVILETMTNNGQRTIMLQKYLDAIVTTGDKRIILIDGNPVPIALARIPSEGDHRGNMDAGARTELVPLTEREAWICEQIGPTLREKGLVFAGIDIIGGFLTELNVTSPTGIREIEDGSTFLVSQLLFDTIESRLEHR